ncbi:MAG: DUF1800 domain-containing protein [Planctomycetales bacterium]|nr:DUF1800 domain-containing protein [Planctomycetales bacterium]
MRTLALMDPRTAWAPFEPSEKYPWDRRAAAHLYRRAGFGANQQQLDAAVSSQPQAVVDELLEQARINRDAEQFDALALSVSAGDHARQLAAAWLYRMQFSPAQLLEKMTLFWHGHFATSCDKVQSAHLMWRQNDWLRSHALGEFRKMVQGIAQDPAMLLYLDSATNRKSHPNENFARELMELFCMGEGQYTEENIRELARCFTGWEVKREKFRLNARQHDQGLKAFFGREGSFSGEAGVDIVLDQPAVPQFLARKLYDWFVADEPAPTEELLAPLVRTLRDSELQIAPVVRQILTSNWFYSSNAIGQKVRSPIELALGLLLTLEGTTDSFALSQRLDQLGHSVFYPPNVKGWDGGRTWINSATLLARANLVRHLLTDENSRFGGGSLSELVERHGCKSPETLVHWASDTLCAIPPDAVAINRLESLAKQFSGDRQRQAIEVIHALSTLPEFQLA